VSANKAQKPSVEVASEFAVQRLVVADQLQPNFALQSAWDRSLSQTH
jgi:hypothetical protein